jgi:hypothetical protein
MQADNNHTLDTRCAEHAWWQVQDMHCTPHESPVEVVSSICHSLSCHKGQRTRPLLLHLRALCRQLLQHTLAGNLHKPAGTAAGRQGDGWDEGGLC